MASTLSVPGRITVLGLSGALALSLTIAPSAQGNEREIDRIEARIAELQSQAETAAEDHHEARERLRAIEKDIATISDRLARNQAQLEGVNRALNAVAATAWRSGGIDPTLQLLLANDAEVFLSTATALDQVARNRNAALRRTATLRLTLRQDRLALAARRAEAKAAVTEMAAHKARAAERLNAATAVLQGLKASQRRAYEARLRAQREASAAAARKAQQSAVRTVSTGPVSARVQKVLTYSLAQVGDRYLFAAEGDDAFDCSGLVIAAFKRAGISLPHSSRAQFRMTKRIARNQLKPGDLVFFFGRGAAHVGIYIGNSKFVHAANPREDVVITSLNHPWYVARYSGAGRVMG
jgi:peptidoglycan DL-endopeptidase CwlO